ncbi:MAG TPA: VWA domain-containing protein [Myxococcales bacterium]|nr:VWA domain-containing protein [Myxococcales bacterium]
MHPGKVILAAALLAPSLALAAGSQLSIQQVEVSKAKWPHARGYVNVIGASGSPIPNLPQDLFKVYEQGSNDSQKIEKVESLETAQTGASIVIVVQASGAMLGIQDDIKKAVAAFVNGLGEKDQVAVVDYAEAAETVAPFSDDKGDVAGKAGKITFTGKSFLLYDGLAQAISLYASAAAPGKGGQAASTLPAAKAIIVISDGRDNGSATDVEKVISDAMKRRIPIHCVGHSELDQDSLSNLEMIARRTNAVYKAAPSVDDINKALTVIKDYINKMYVVQWKTGLDHDGKDHKVEIAMESESGAPLRSSIMVKTPSYIDWIKIGIITGVILLLVIIAVAIYIVTRPKPPPPRFCPVCKRVQMPEWDICLFCLKSAKARLVMQKGAGPKGKTWPLVGKIVSLGSGPENSIRIMDGAVSGKHAGVSIDNDKFEIVDLGSKNGVLVNGKKTPRRFLRNGDIVTLGMTEFKFESTIAAPDDEADD